MRWLLVFLNQRLRGRFGLTDNDSVVTVKYTGILPDLFREGQGVIANGRLNASGEFVVQEVLAKHDENYIPLEVMEAMKKSGATHARSTTKGHLAPSL